MSFLDAIDAQGGVVYEVGGSVRDRFLDYPSKDSDLLVCGIPWADLKRLLLRFGSVLEVGKSFGILKFRNREDGREYDVALPRTEKSTGPGHRDFEVHFDAHIPVERDLERRDFTINAIARELKSGRVLDPFHGLPDLKQRVLRQVFENSFVEDPLRLLRAVQFMARFELRLNPETFAAMKRHAPLIQEVSSERIIEEVGKLLRAPQPSLGFYLMKDTGLLSHVFPELEKTIGVLQPAKRGADVFDHTMQVLDAARSSPDVEQAGDLEILLASLFHDVGKPYTQDFSVDQQRLTFHGHQIVSTKLARQWLKKYHAAMLGINPDNVLTLVNQHMFETTSFHTDRAIRRFIHKVGKDLIFKLLDLRIADKKGGAFPDKFKGILKLKEKIKEELEKKPPFGPKDLALNGSDLMRLGYAQGPLLGKILNSFVELVLDEPEKNTRQCLENYAAEHFPL